MDSTIRASQQLRTVKPEQQPALALLLVATPVDTARWTVLPVDRRLVLERVAGRREADGLMSRLHATVETRGDRLQLRDGVRREGIWRRSANGTYGPTGEPLGANPIVLRPGDTFQTGNSLWMVIQHRQDDDPDTLLRGFSDAIHRAREDLRMVVRQVVRRLGEGTPVNLSVLVTGPRGSGKQVVAREAHRLLQLERPGAPFRQVSAPSLADGTTAADLFGVVGQYATDVKARSGYFEQADGGVLLLDEVADTPLEAQAKLMNVLQEREVTPLGGTKPIKFNTLVIGATNQPLEADEESGGFRRDLIDRLSTFRIMLPPLRERPEDIPPLVQTILDQTGYPVPLSAELMRALIISWWSGNVRELRSCIERLVALAEHTGQAPDLKMLDRVTDQDDESRESSSVPAPTETVRRRPPKADLEAALRECQGNRSELARRWGTDPRQIRRWVAYYDLADD